jgi:TolA-binding protein
MDGKIMKSIINKIIGFTFVLTLCLPLAATTVGISNFTVSEGIDANLASNIFESELLNNKDFTVRRKDSMTAINEQLKKCQHGLMSCDAIDPDAKKGIDLFIFGDIHKEGDQFLVNIRAIRQNTWTVYFSKFDRGKNSDDVLKDLASDLAGQLKKTNDGSGALIDDAKELDGKYRVAIQDVKFGNAAAQKVNISTMLNSILGTALGGKGKFIIVENSRVNDILKEKKLEMEGIVDVSNTAFNARGVTHILVSTLSVDGDVKSLKYQIVSVKTNLPIVENIIEWTDVKEIKKATEEVAKFAEEEIFVKNGKLDILECDPSETRIFFENKEKGTQIIDIGFCPKSLEDVPAGKYTVLFKNEDRETLTMQIEVKAQELLKIPKVVLPPLDLSDYQKAAQLEGQGNYIEAKAAYRKFYERYPKNRMAQFAMYREGFMTQVYLKKYEEGKQILDELIKRKPDAEIRSEAYFGIGMGYHIQGKLDERNNIMKMLINEFPGSTASDIAKLCLEENQCNL